MTASNLPIRDIIVVVDLGGERQAAKIAVELARKTGAHLTGLCVAFDPLVAVYTVGAPIPTDFLVAAREQAAEEAKAAAAAFEALGAAAGVSIETRIVESATGDGFIDLARQARLSDLVVVGQQDPERTEPARDSLIEAILFQASAPTLLIPYIGVNQLKTDRVAIAWNGSATAARAVRSALPLIAGAKKVLVAVVEEGGRKTGEPGADIATYLARHGLDVTVRTVPWVANSAGVSLLNFAADESADLLVMGAYGHSRMREFLLGGATREILLSATLPVFLSH